MIQRSGIMEPMKRILLVGGFPQDAKRIGAILRPFDVSIDWQWENRMAGSRRGFPDCDAVIVTSRACSHDLSASAQAQANKAGVPLVVFDSKARSLVHLRRAGIVPMEEPVPVAKPAPKPPLPTPPQDRARGGASALASAALTLNVPPPPPTPIKEAVKSDLDRLDEILVEAHEKWTNLQETTKKAFLHFLDQFEVNRNTSIPKEVAALLNGYKNRPRHYTAMMLIATQGHNVTQAVFKQLHSRLYELSIESTMINRSVERAQGLCGPDVGLRRGDHSKKVNGVIPTPPVVAPVVLPPMESILEVLDTPLINKPVETPVAAPAPVQTPPVLTLVPPPMVERFNRLLMAAIDSGERVTVQKSATGYSITYEDGVTVTLSAKG